MDKKKKNRNKYSSTLYINIIKLNFFQLKLIKQITKNEQKKNTIKNLCKHTMSLIKEDRRNDNKNSIQKLQAHHVTCDIRYLH